MSSSEIPKFLVSRRYISVVIAFILVFSVLFLLIYRPFSMAVWFSVDNSLRFGFTMLFYFGAIVTLILSRVLMYSVQNRIELTPITYMWWIMGENLIISLEYTLLTVNYFPVEGLSTPMLATRALMCVTLILAIPNAIVSFYAAYKSKCEELDVSQYQLQKMREEYRLLENSTLHELKVAQQFPAKPEPAPRMINLYDNGGTLRLTLNIDSLYYLESEDNYIRIFYKHNDKILSYMLRSRTRSIEESLKGTCMVRCHRSFIVNINKISVMEEEKRMHYIRLDDETIKRIPVSKSYYDTLVTSLNTISS